MLDGTVYLIWDYSGIWGWSCLSRKRIPVVENQLHCKEVNNVTTEGFVNLVRDVVSDMKLVYKIVQQKLT